MFQKKKKKLSWSESCFILFTIIVGLVYLCAWCMYVGPCAMVPMRRSKDNALESILFFHLKGSWELNLACQVCVARTFTYWALSAAWKLYILFIHHWKYLLLLLLCVDVRVHTIVCVVRGWCLWSWFFDLCVDSGDWTWVARFPLPTRPPGQGVRYGSAQQELDNFHWHFMF